VTAVIEKPAYIQLDTLHMAAAETSTSGISESTLRQVLDLSCEGILILRVDDDVPYIRYANSQFTRLSGFTVDELTSRQWADVCRDICSADVADVLLRNESYCGTLLMVNADGTRWRSGVRIRTLVESGNDNCIWLCQFIPPTLMSGEESDLPQIWFDQDCAGIRQRFGRLDRIDSSSGLLRFERFRDFFERDLVMAARDKKPATLILLRIPEFDEYRCTFGVNAANSCLGMIGKQVTAALRRRTDLCARMNEDTIVVAVVGQSSDDVAALVNRISENVEGLRIHNPRGRYSRFLSLRSAFASCEVVTASESVEALIRMALTDLDLVTAETLTA
jgi:diguanylate cyclase (GGDEF)-like protein